MGGRQALRALLGLALAPFVAAAVVAIAGPFFLGARSFHIVSASGSTSYQSPSLAYRALITGAVVTLLGALPACVVFRQRRWTRLGQYLGLGALLGASPFLLYLAFALGPMLTNGAPGEVLARLVPLMTLGAIAGGVAAAVFWVVAVRSARDRPGAPRN